jgi:hypothetical protein
MYINGSIPKRIVYYHLPEKKIHQGVEWNLDSLNNKENVLPAAVADPLDPKSINNAQNLLKNYQKIIKIIPKSVEVDNKPIKDVKIFSISRRYSSGLQYKILIRGYLLDLKEDVLLDALIKEGATNGILNGEYIWAKIGTNTKLVRIGSELYNMIINFENKKNMKPIPKKQLQVGGLYQNKKGEISIYLGPVNTIKLFSNNKKFKFNQKLIKNHMLFCSAYSHDNSKKIKKEFLSSPENYRFLIKKDHSLIEKVDYIDLPADIVDKVRKIFIKKMKHHIVEYNNKMMLPGTSYPMMNSNYLEYLYYNISKLLNLHQTGSKPVDIFDINKYLAFC